MSPLANENYFWRYQLEKFPQDAVHDVWSLLSTEFKLAQTKVSEMSSLLGATEKRRADFLDFETAFRGTQNDRCKDRRIYVASFGSEY